MCPQQQTLGSYYSPGPTVKKYSKMKKNVTSQISVMQDD